MQVAKVKAPRFRAFTAAVVQAGGGTTKIRLGRNRVTNPFGETERTALLTLAGPSERKVCRLEKSCLSNKEPSFGSHDGRSSSTKLAGELLEVYLRGPRRRKVGKRGKTRQSSETP